MNTHKAKARVVPFLDDKNIEFLGLIGIEGMIEFLSNIIPSGSLFSGSPYFLKSTGIQQIRSTVSELDWRLEPHPDIRKVGILYTLQGPAESVWYSINEPLRPNTSYQKEFEQGRLTEIERSHMELHAWYLYDHENIHSVEHCLGTRTSIAINLGFRFQNFSEALAAIDSINF
jgi:hypothetical protein